MGQAVGLAGATAAGRGTSASGVDLDVVEDHRVAARSRACPACPSSARCAPPVSPSESGKLPSERRGSGRFARPPRRPPSAGRGEPLEKVLRPATRQPVVVRVAVVRGRPPRLGLPISGSLASLLINAPLPPRADDHVAGNPLELRQAARGCRRARGPAARRASPTTRPSDASPLAKRQIAEHHGGD